MALDNTTTGASSNEYSFAKYNTTTNVYSYSSDEYLSHLRDESGNWSREETDYLFNLCHEYDLRWFVIKDRWDFDNPEREGGSSITEEVKPASNVAHTNGSTAPGNNVNSEPAMKVEDAASASNTPAQDSGTADKASASTPVGPFAAAATQSAPTEPTQQAETQTKRERTIEEMKDRYYSVCRKLIRARPASDENAKQALLQSYAFDKGKPDNSHPWPSCPFRKAC